ncbi:DEAD/DEAH box helicase [Candidatus Woesearchaeota archaeon]|nr:DEAD/DEAH box helicase [Candidatus Woesearchaeota archaeon]
MNLFEKFGLSQETTETIKKLGFTKPTLIQEKSIPMIVQGKDVIGESATGSGKTLAFGCGIVEHTVPGKGLQTLVLAPTRELAEQVRGVINTLAHKKKLKILSIYGGVAINPQIHDLPKADVVVATPGRLLDHLQRRTVDLSKVKLLVLDEADRMFDMGFIEDIERIIRFCPKKRQTLFFSATISNDVKKFAKKYMIEPTKVAATKMVDPKKLKQVYYDVSKNQKLSLLIHLLKNEDSGLVMVFCNTRKNTDFVTKNLKANKISAIAIHGGLTQNKRTKTIDMFNNAKVGALVCTDVAARGLDIDNVSHVYNYDIPKDAKDYVHRIGRTARAGEEGKVINILCDYDHDNFSRILREYREFVIDKLQVPALERVIVKKDSPRRRAPAGRGRFARSHNGRKKARARH